MQAQRPQVRTAGAATFIAVRRVPDAIPDGKHMY